MTFNFKGIQKVQLSTELIDIVLSKTQRKTPTVVHSHYNSSKIKSFYMKKVKFTGNEFSSKFNKILKDFPRLEDIHPFYCDLINVLYDRDHYKMALGHIHSVKGVIDSITQEYVKLLKFGESLYRCKQLKRTALGRMTTVVKKLKKTLEYLEEVRQHMSRIPNIDPTARTILICGFPNVGKSSFINTISRAQVDVQPYAFTTKSLYVGHFDYNYLRWQVIDTPGILDHPLEDRNTIEMQSITALAHLKATILYFLDISESCGFSIEEQISLYESLAPLLKNNILIVLSKSDLKKLNCCEEKEAILKFLEDKKYVEMSVNKEENVEGVKKIACDMLLDERLERKVNSEKINDFINRISLVKPAFLSQKEECVLNSEKVMTEKEKKLLDEDYFFDERMNYVVDEEMKYDDIPEIADGKNLADFVDRDILKKLKELEEEEDQFIKNVYSKKYDTLSNDERRFLEDMNYVRKENIGKHVSKRRAAVPERWKNRKVVRDQIQEARFNEPTALVKYTKKIEKDKNHSTKDRFTKLPKHIYRGKSKHGFKNR